MIDKLILSLCLCTPSAIIVSAQETNTENIINSVTREIELFCNCDLSVTKTFTMYDVLANPSWICIDYEPSAYAIASFNGVISEFAFGVTSEALEIGSAKDWILYAGPGNTAVFQTQAELTENIQLLSDELVEINETVLNQNEYPIAMESILNHDGQASINASGINAGNLSKYVTASWFPTAYVSTNQNGICGTIAAAQLLAYYDDYSADAYVPASIRIRYSSTPGTLISTYLYPVIDGLYPNGTLPTHIANGINNFLTNYSGMSGVYAQSAVTTWTPAKAKLDAGKPVLIGTLAVLNSPLGNHWVFAYDYFLSGSGHYYYVCLPNISTMIGTTAYNVNVGWTSGVVYIP
ncbi:MAG: hypothetical protein IJ252_00575 [Solobacterium sp.]|nr:hypothetical protein [Solobacterium sp.]